MIKKWEDTIEGKIEQFFNKSPEEIDAFLRETNFDFYNQIDVEVIARNHDMDVLERFSVPGGLSNFLFSGETVKVMKVDLSEAAAADNEARYALAA